MISVVFSEPMKAATLNTDTFTLQDGGGNPVAGTVTVGNGNTTATFTPSAALGHVTTYTVTITTGAQDAAGNALASNRVWRFTTQTSPDTTAPRVTATVPAANATGVSASSEVKATFSEPMNAATVTTGSFTLQDGGGNPVAGAVTVGDGNTTATFTPSAALGYATTYTATITTHAQDAAGNAMASNRVWSFTTRAAPDTTPPTVTGTVPAANATGVPVGNPLSATFSEAMKAGTLNTGTFTLQDGGGNPVSGSVTLSGGNKTATFTPSAALGHATTYTATITTGAQDAAGNALASNHAWSFTTDAAPDTTAPTVTATVPSASATGVSVDTTVSATFSEPMDPATVNTNTFTLQDGGGNAVAGSVTLSGGNTTATFTPSAALGHATTYTATITTNAQDAAGNALASNHAWSFTTQAAPDTTAPTVTGTVPDASATGVPVDSTVSATFSEPMDAATLNTGTFTLQDGSGNAVAGSVTAGNGNTTATFTPSAALAHATTYTATITTGAQDAAGNAMASNHSWSFTTQAAPDTTPPTVTGTAPAASATDVPVDTTVTATFSEAMDAATVMGAFTLQDGSGTAVAGSVTLSNGDTTATFTPNAALANATNYTATITTGAHDAAGNAMAADYTWSFTTSPPPP